MNCKLQSQLDIWTEVLTFLGDIRDLVSWNSVSKTARKISSMSEAHLALSFHRRQDWSPLSSLLDHFTRLKVLDIYACNCSFDLLRPMIPLVHDSPFNNKINISIAKCFLMQEETIHILQICERAALCDIDISHSIHPPAFTSLQTLILSNCKLEGVALSHIWSNFPENLTLLGLGGAKGVHDFSALSVDPCLRWNIVVDVTFLSVPDREFLEGYFPHAMKIDLTKDPLDCLDQALRVGGIDSMSGMKSALLSCSNSLNQTPLHLSCIHRTPDRTMWLLKHGALVTLKDTRGSTPLHRAAMPTQTNRTEGDVEDLCAITDSVRALIRAEPECCFYRNQAYETPIFTAALRGNSLVLQQIISILTGKDNAWKSDGNEVSVSHSGCGASECTVKSFCQVTKCMNRAACDDRKFTPLHAAVINRNMECCTMLLESGLCCPNWCNSNGSTPLHLAYRTKEQGIIDLLLAYGASATIQDTSGLTPEKYGLSESLGKKSRSSSNRRKEKPSSL